MSASAGSPSGELFFFVLLALMALPVVQLAAAVLAIGIVAVAPSSSVGSKKIAIGGIASIAAGTIVGALVGFGAMVLLGMILSHH
jgi:hypothetical protein